MALKPTILKLPNTDTRKNLCGNCAEWRHLEEVEREVNEDA